MARNIPTDLLRSFVTVVDLGGFTRAAEALGISRATLYRRMREFGIQRNGSSKPG